MSLPSNESARGWPGRTMVDRDGDTVGEISHVYLDRDSGRPAWALVTVPERGGRAFVPLSGSGMRDDRVTVAVLKATVCDAPDVRVGRRLSGRHEARLHDHYGGTPEEGSRGARRARPDRKPADATKAARARLGQAGTRARQAGTRVRQGAGSGPGRRLLSAAGAVSALVATAVVAGRAKRRRRGGLAGALDGLLATPAARRRRRRR